MLKDKLATQGATVGKYRIDARIAEGGMGVFWRAIDTKLDRTVGLKTLHAEFTVEPQLRERFINEARALAKLNHPNICVLHDFFEAGEQLYIVMEYIQGETLADLVRHRGALPRSEVVPIFRQILLALDYAHNHGVIHRDIKPSNIMVSEQGIVKVMDFGIAKMVEAPVQLTRTGRKVGSILFMSPEQIREQPVDHRSDLYSLGVTLFQVSTGNVPFDATSEYEAMKAHLEDAPPSPRSINPAIAEDLEYVILRAMAKRPEDRFQNALEMRTALGIADAEATSDRVAIASGDKTRVDVGPDPVAPPLKKRGLRKVLLASGFVLAALLALGVLRHLRLAPTEEIPQTSARQAQPRQATGPAAPTAAAGQGESHVSDPVAKAALRTATDSAATGAVTGEPVSTQPSAAAAVPPVDKPAVAVGAGALTVARDAPPAVPSEDKSTVTQSDKPKSATSVKAPRKATTGDASPAMKEPERLVSQPEESRPPAKPVVLKKHQLTVTVIPAGHFQVDRLGWWQTGGRLEEGPHRLEVMGAGFPIFVAKFQLRQDTTITVDLDAASARATAGDLRVSAKTAAGEFPACQVKINGEMAGALPGLRLPLRSGLYEIELVPPDNLVVDSLQFEGQSHTGARARIKVPPTTRTFARYFLSARR